MYIVNYNDVYFDQERSFNTTDIIGLEVLHYVYMGYNPCEDFEPIED